MSFILAFLLPASCSFWNSVQALTPGPAADLRGLCNGPSPASTHPWTMSTCTHMLGFPFVLLVPLPPLLPFLLFFLSKSLGGVTLSPCLRLVCASVRSHLTALPTKNGAYMLGTPKCALCSECSLHPRSHSCYPASPRVLGQHQGLIRPGYISWFVHKIC